jgi:uncharacterized membrane protein
MNALSATDVAAIAIYLASWIVYHYASDRWNRSRDGVNARMARARESWMRQMARRDMRMVDTQITASLQNGAAFFASASMIALGASAGLLRMSEEAVHVVATLSPQTAPARALFDLKVIGLAVIFGYAFFKFGWSYRLFNYSAVLIGATPPADDPDAEAREAAIRRAARMNIAAGAHFARGQRALFFAVAYLGWFASPWLLIATTLFVVVIMLRRQFASDARAAFDD